jgi:hypothetical protein
MTNPIKLLIAENNDCANKKTSTPPSLLGNDLCRDIPSITGKTVQTEVTCRRVALAGSSLDPEKWHTCPWLSGTCWLSKSIVFDLASSDAVTKPCCHPLFGIAGVD